MSYNLVDRPDGKVEIILTRQILVGIFPERHFAQRVRAFLSAEEPELPDDAPACFGAAQRDVDQAELDDLSDIDKTLPPVRLTSAAVVAAELPAVIDQPKTRTVRLSVTPNNQLTSEQIDSAFRLISEGRKISEVAAPLGLTMAQLRGMWANHKRQLQKHMAEGGRQKCAQCERQFTPSVSSPDLCARCSHE